MQCLCWPNKAQFTTKARALARDTARLLNVMIGVGDYDAYLSHMQKNHPDQPAMDRPSFVTARQNARFGIGSMRCC